MATTLINMTAYSTPTTSEALRAQELLSRLTEAGYDPTNREMVLQAFVGPGSGAGNTIPLPAQVIPMLLDILAQMANGNAVTLVPHHAILTTQEAAEILNVSRPYLIGLLDSGKIPCQMVGKHRRIAADELFRYQRREAEARAAVLAELAAEGQSLEEGY